MVEERRRHRRYPLVLAVSWGDARLPRDHTEDLSAGGLFVRTERNLPSGEPIPIELSFPGLLERLKLTVEVVRRREAGPLGPPGVGLSVAADRPDELLRLEALARAASLAGSGGRTCRVLLVEDNALVATMYASALRRLSAKEGMSGLEVEIAGDGDRALERLRREPRMDLVITDVYMPGLDGLKLLERIRGEAAIASTPVVVISAGGADEGMRASDLGAQFFLRKPVKYQDFVATVRTLLIATGKADLRAILGAAEPSPPAAGGGGR